MRYLLTECRSSPRRSCDIPLAVVWKDPRGRLVHSTARCIDISDSGARIEYHEALAKLTPIHLSSPDNSLVKNGKVRVCLQVGSAYHVGIEFC